MDTWTHPTLGEFKSNDWRWVQKEYHFKSLIEVFPNYHPVHELSIEVNENDCNQLGDDDPLPQPSDNTLEVTSKILNNLSSLVKQALRQIRMMDA